MADDTTSHRDPSQHPEDEGHDHLDDVDADPETRMLRQIAALESAESPAESAAELGSDADQPAEPEPESAPVDPTSKLEPVAATAGGAGPNEPKQPVSQPAKRRRWPWVIALIVVLLGGSYVAAAFVTQDAPPATLTVEGVDVSGLSIDEAAPALEETFAQRAGREITVTVEDHEAVIVPAESGFSYDVDATLDQLTSLTFNPVVLWGRLFGEAHIDAVKAIDDDTVAEAIAGLTEQLTFDPTEGAVVYEGASLEYSAPVDGFTPDSDALAGLLAEEWLGEQTQFPAPGQIADPVVSAQMWEDFVATTAQPLIEDSYTVTAGDASTDLTPAQLGAAAEVRIEAASDQDAEGSDEADTVPGDRPVLILDGDALTAALAENNSDLQSTNQDASIRLAGSAGSGRPEVVPGATGRGVQSDQVVQAIQADLAAEQSRSITVELLEVEPEISTEDAEAWDVNYAVADYATPYPASDGPRTANLRVGAERINGTVVMPGEEFNLNALLAPITAANGYVSSGVVESGVTTTALGGGLSQIATMAYNAGFLGGMEIVEHKPHSRWFDRYPQGRESTYWEGQINVRWQNDTPAPVIVEMWLTDSQVNTRLWGSDYYDVSTTTSEPYAHTPSPTIRNSDSDCIPERGGREGFTVDVHRTKTPPDGNAIQESWRWAYTGWPRVICE